MLEFLQKHFGTTEDGQPKALTYEQLEAAATADKEIKAVNLKAGGYVSQEKYDADVKSQKTRAEGLQEQLDHANEEIKSYKDMDIDGVKKKAAEWEEKYNTETKALNEKLQQQEVAHQRDLYFAGIKFASEGAKIGVMALFDKENFVLKDGVFQGADAWIKALREKDPASFAQEEDEKDGNKDKDGQGEGQDGSKEPDKPLPNFATKTSNGSGQDASQSQDFGFGFTGVRPRPDQK